MDNKEIVKQIKSVDEDCVIKFKEEICYDFAKFHRCIMRLKTELEKDIQKGEYNDMSIDEQIYYNDKVVNKNMAELLEEMKKTDKEVERLHKNG